MEGKTVLVIDDEQVVLDSVHKILTAEAFTVVTTSDGKDGIHRAIREPTDIVLSDIRMPDVDGLMVLRDIKRVKPGLPVVIITGYASVGSAVQAMKLGAANYIEKPFTPDELVRSVVSALSTASDGSREEPTIVHVDEMKKILEKGASDPSFARWISGAGADALADFDLTNTEKLAILTGDVNWIEDQIGILATDRKKWLINLQKQY